MRRSIDDMVSLRLAGGDVVADLVRPASGWWGRTRGLIGRRSLLSGEVLVIKPCARVHTFGMRFPIDLVFCDDSMQVLSVSTIEPNRLSARVRDASCCIEMGAGRAHATGIVLGVRLELRSDA